MKLSKKAHVASICLITIIVLLISGYAIDRFQLIEGFLFGVPTSSQADKVFVHYIDVGQGECILIQTPQGNVLIDTGENSYANRVIDYLHGHNVRYIDILVATHPHSDHIGGMGEIIRSFGIGRMMMPRASHNTLSYERMLLAMQEYGLKAHVPMVGEQFALGGVEFMVVAPNSEQYENLNDYSIVLRMTYGDHSFLFTGDAEAVSEMEMVGNDLDIGAQFLNIGHHGSRTSTTENFLDQVDPRVAVISLAKGNSYGHPHPEVLARLATRGIEVYRTDRDGDIVLVTDGERYRIGTSGE